MEKASKSERLREELRKYAIISIYLFICFAVILFYDTSVRGLSAGDPLPWTAALIKALVLGKFILIGEALSVGARANHHPLLNRVVLKSLALLGLLIVFKVIEELVIGWFHDKAVTDVIAEFQATPWIGILAPIALMLLILVPLVTASEVHAAVGTERFRAILLER